MSFSAYMHELCFSKWLPGSCPLCRKVLCTLQYQRDAIARAMAESGPYQYQDVAGGVGVVIDLTGDDNDAHAVIDLTED